jgi:hypothetical protein
MSLPALGLARCKASFFPVPASVVFGERADASVPLAAPPEAWPDGLPVQTPRATACYGAFPLGEARGVSRDIGTTSS